MASIERELDDIQGNILRAYGFPFARYEVVRIVNRNHARQLLRRVLDQKLVTTAAAWDPASKPAATLNVFFSWPGLAAIGVPQDSLDSFPEEFRQGMAARAALLGDRDANGPDRWEFGNDPDRNHVFFAVYGRTLADRDRLLETLRAELAASPAVEVAHQLDAAMLENGREHFGFADGFGQPSIQGSGAPIFPGEGTLQADGTWKEIAAGEFVLGWPGETGQPVEMPRPEALARNGSFLVYRKLEQHVGAFRAFLAKEAERLYGDTSASSVELLAAKLVGRWRSGCPLALASHADDPALAADWNRNNDFGYAADLAGQACPYGSHIRRMNPRDGRTNGALVRTHRIVRRGLPYGTTLTADADDGQERGVAFMAINASIRFQFEFLQTEWINNGEFADLSRDEVDPFVGERRPRSRFRIPDPRGAPRNIFDLPAFVTLRGGGYYFVPSISAMRFIAAQTG